MTLHFVRGKQHTHLASKSERTYENGARSVAASTMPHIDCPGTVTVPVTVTVIVSISS